MAMPEQIEIKHERSSAYRVCIVDSATATVIFDNVGARIDANLVRVDKVIISETATIPAPDQISFVPGARITTEFQKTVEFSMQLRPDAAISIINALIEALNKLPEHHKSQYGIPVDLQNITPRPIGI
jgi:hypothetical protein